MISLLLIAVFWVVIVAGIVIFGGRSLPKVWWVNAIRILVFVVLIPLPLVDELVARPKFEQLCREKALITVDLPNSRGRTVTYKDSQRTDLEVSGIRVVRIRRN